MQVIIVGTGKLATELLNTLGGDRTCDVVSWADKDPANNKSIVVHAGSGRELRDVMSYCEEMRAPLVELATGSQIELASPAFPVVLCPNTNILMLKFMNMLEKSGHLFGSYRITLTESHQAQKTSVPGTAVSMARALGLDTGDVRSVRDREAQRAVLQIPVEHLDRHAYHRIVIEDAACSVIMETRVYGESPYADGVARIISAIRSNMLENRVYQINEFIEAGWI